MTACRLDMLKERATLLQDRMAFRDARKALKLTQQGLADELDLQGRQISAYERGEADIPRPIAFLLGAMID